LTACRTEAAKYRSASSRSRRDGNTLSALGQRKKSAQNGIKDNLPFGLPNQPRVHLFKSLYGPKSERFVKDGDRLEVEGRQLEVVPRSSAITHTGILNPNFVQVTFTPRFAAIRFMDGVSADMDVKSEHCVGDCRLVSYMVLNLLLVY
jgi:hypothetical protein